MAVIDMADFENNKETIIEQMTRAAAAHGFFQLINHGISEAETDEAFATSQRYFELPYETKQRGAIRPLSTVPFGYECPARQTDNPNADLKESLLGSFRPDAAGIWPSDRELPGGKARLEKFMLRCSALNTRILEALEDGVGLRRGVLSEAHRPELADCMNVTRLIYYPALTARTDRARCSAHKDFCGLTCLFQRPGQPGLEVFIPATNRWIAVAPTPGAVTINCGEMLAYQTDGLLKSNLHRVKTPQPGAAGVSLRARYSLAFFANGSSSATIKGEVTGANPPVTISDFYTALKVADASHPGFFQSLKQKK